ncbi:ComEA family DNA-binding protein [Metallococcus carri]|uniref:ComEA family DNA-binding protein n=1 Tax=Metallococcus carri TaxID=1656884 RepID=UPI001F29B61E|nr:ComEA family DNA-binding protein [Metallococcus carri]
MARTSTGRSPGRSPGAEPADRLAAILAEVEQSRRTPGWVPEEAAVFDRPTPMQRFATRAERRGRPEGRGRAEQETVRPREPLIRAPASFSGARTTPAQMAVLGLVALVVAVAAVLAVRVSWARDQARPQPVTAPTGLRTSAVGGTGPGVTATTAGAPGSGLAGATARSPAGGASSAPTTVVVHVVGQVRRPGVVSLRVGARVSDAVQAAGGALPSADLTNLNLARVLTDGEQIRVPKPGEVVTPPPVPGGGAGAGAGAGGGGAGAGSGGSAGPTAPVNLNTADETALDTLPGVGPVLASRIVQWRTANGRFTSVDELGEVSGIGDKLLEQLRPLVTV